MNESKALLSKLSSEHPLMEKLLDASLMGHLCLKDEADYPACDWIQKFHGCYYLQKNWESETQIVSLVKEFLSQPPQYLFDGCCEQDEEFQKLMPEQKEAIKYAFQNRFSIITGGPGTGKTYTAGVLIRCLMKALPKANFQIGLGAPTGKAALQLQASLNRMVGPSEDLFEKGTLHRLLGKNCVLPYDLILVDEASMIDIKWMIQLFKSIKKGARLIMLGDPNQLPPVEAASVFHDLVDFLKTPRLKTCLRAELASIAHFADLLLEKRGDLVLDWLRHQSDIQRAIFKTPEELVAHYFPLSYTFLTPLRKGPWGVENLNRLCLKHVSKPFILSIMISVNDERLGLYNGEVGSLHLHHDLKPSLGDYAIFNGRKIPALVLPRWEWAFAITVHKSQGSEFDRVICLLPEGSEKFGNNMLYTGATRAKKELHLLGSDEVLKATVEQNSRRRSNIADRLQSSQLGFVVDE